MNITVFDILGYAVGAVVGAAVLFVVFRWRSR